jgi:hypothetical protein
VRRRGGWRFGTAKISDTIVERLVASGDASIDGETVKLTRKRRRPMTMLSIMAAELDRELLFRGITVIDRDACEEIITNVLKHAALAAALHLEAGATETPERRH